MILFFFIGMERVGAKGRNKRIVFVKKVELSSLIVW